MESSVPARVTPIVSPDSVIASWKCLVGTISATTTVPSSTHCVPNAHSPHPVTETAIRFSLRQFHVSVESSVIANVTFVAVPLEGTLPVPVQPVQR